MCRKMTRLALAGKCAGRGSKGSTIACGPSALSWPSNSDNRPGNSSELPANDRIHVRRFMSVEKDKFVAAQQRPGQTVPGLVHGDDVAADPVFQLHQIILAQAK